MQKIAIIIISALLFLTACGGGGSSSITTYSTVTLKINLSGALPTDTAMIGAGFTLTLPAYVTPANTNGVVAGSVVTPSGTFTGASTLPPVYTPATATTPGTLQVALASASASGVQQVGEIATLVLQLSTGAVPTAASFTLNQADVRVTDIFGNQVSGMQAVVAAVQLQ